MRILLVLSVSAVILTATSFALTKNGEPNSPEQTDKYVFIETDKKIFAPGEPIEYRIFYVNNRTAEVELRSIDMEVYIQYLSGREVEHFIIDYLLVGPIVVPPGSQRLIDTFTWEQTSFNYITRTKRQVAPGAYHIRVKLLDKGLSAETMVEIICFGMGFSS